MNTALIRRGPGGEGEYPPKSIALGHRQLSSNAGRQPTLSEDGTVILLTNDANGISNL